MFSSRISFKILAFAALVVLFTGGVVGLLESRDIGVRARDGVERTLREQGALLAQVFGPQLLALESSPQSGAALRAIEWRAEQVRRDTGLHVVVASAAGEVVVDSREDVAERITGDLEGDFEALRSGRVEVVTERRPGVGSEVIVRLTRAVFAESRVVGFLRVGRFVTGVTASRSGLWRNVLTGMLLALAGGVAMGLVFSRRLTTSLNGVTQSVSAMAAGDFSRPALARGRDEVGDLAAACNELAEQMTMRMETLNTERQEVVATLRSMVEGVVATDEDQRVLFVNDSARQMLGIDAEDCVGQPFWALTRVQHFSGLLDATLRHESDVEEEVAITGPRGTRVLQLRLSPLRSESDAVRGVVVVFHDVTELRRLEQIRRDFVSNVSHEFKTPLTAIRGYVDTIVDSDEDLDSATRARFLGKIREQADRLAAMVRDQLTLAKLEAKDAPFVREAVDFRAAVTASLAQVETFVGDKGLVLEVDLPDSPVVTEADPVLIRQITDNLIDNAVKYTPDRGRVRVSLVAEVDSLLFEVEDSGVGLSSEDQKRVFERFYRVDRARSREVGGTGLGLSIVRNAAVAFGGQVLVESELGRGSRFAVRLPLAT